MTMQLNITASSSRTPLSHEVQTKVSPHNGWINKVIDKLKCAYIPTKEIQDRNSN